MSGERRCTCPPRRAGRPSATARCSAAGFAGRGRFPIRTSVSCGSTVGEAGSTSTWRRRIRTSWHVRSAHRPIDRLSPDDADHHRPGRGRDAARSPRPQLGPGGVGRRGRRRRGRGGAHDRGLDGARGRAVRSGSLCDARRRRGAGRPDRRAPARDPARRDPRAPAAAGALPSASSGSRRASRRSTPSIAEPSMGVRSRTTRSTRSCATRAIAARGAAAWDASKEIGPRAAPQVRELARARNEAARGLGYRDYFAMSLELQELTRAGSSDCSIVSSCCSATHGRVRRARSTRRSERGSAFPQTSRCGRGTTPSRSSRTRRWSTATRSRQRSPGLDPLTVSRAYFDALGDPIEGILSRSDLYPRAAQEPARVLHPGRPRRRRADPREHRAGRALARDDAPRARPRRLRRAIDRSLPWLLRRHAHIFATEAIAMLHGRRTRDPIFLRASAASLPSWPTTRSTGRSSAARCTSSARLGAGDDPLRARNCMPNPTPTWHASGGISSSATSSSTGPTATARTTGRRRSTSRWRRSTTRTTCSARSRPRSSSGRSSGRRARRAPRPGPAKRGVPARSLHAVRGVVALGRADRAGDGLAPRARPLRHVSSVVARPPRPRHARAPRARRPAARASTGP